MKRLSSLILVIYVFVSITFSQWQNQSFVAENISYSSIFMQNDSIGWLSGYYTVSRTTDRGDSWSSISLADNGNQVKKIKFMDEHIGFAIGSLTGKFIDCVYKTIDGGLTWQFDSSLFALSSPLGLRFSDVTFTTCPDYKYVWLSAAANTPPKYPGYIYCSKDSGNTWTEFTKTPDTALTYSRVLFLDSLRGFIMIPKALFRTTNSGNTWDQTDINDGEGFFDDIQFFNSDTGIFYAQGSVSPASCWIGKTYNGGESWTIDTSTIGFFSFAPSRKFHFMDLNRGFAVSDGSGSVLRTTDGGTTWIPTFFGGTSPLQDIHSADGKNVIATGGRKILVSHNAGETYKVLTPPEVVNFNYVKYLSENLVVAFANSRNLFLSIDSGKSWTISDLPGALIRNQGIFFLDSVNGWIADDSSEIFHTADLGKTWIKQKAFQIHDRSFEAIHFSNEQFGCAVGWLGYIMATYDGGEHWELKTSNGSAMLFGVFVASANKAWAVGDAGTILVSNDSCNSWISQVSPVNARLRTVTFTDTLNGYVLGDGGIILKTSNGGKLWELVPSPDAMLTAIKFVNTDKGWVIGKRGKIFQTLNGGKQWESQTSGVDTALTGIDFIDTTRGIIVGKNGVVLRTHNSGNLTLMNGTISHTPLNFILEQNFPNPFNPSTIIRYEMPSQTNVTLKIYNMLGQEVITLVNETKQSGRYNVRWNAAGMASGIYFYRITAGEFVESKKLLLLK